MTISHLNRVLALGAATLALSIGGAFAATTDSSVNVLSGPGAHFKTVGTLDADTSVTLAHKSGSWCDISGPAKGWVPCTDLNGATKTAAEAPAPSSGWHGYDYYNDPYLGPNFGGLHQTDGAEGNL